MERNYKSNLSPSWEPPRRYYEAEVENPSTTKIPNDHTIRIKTIEDVDRISDYEIRCAKLSEVSKARVQKLVDEGENFFQAKRTVIKTNFIRHNANKVLADMKEVNLPSLLHKAMREESELRNDLKYPQSRRNTEFNQPRSKRARMGNSTPETVLIVDEGYPVIEMGSDKQTAVRTTIMEALDNIPDYGPQVRFVRCIHRPGQVVMICADRESADWLRDVVPTLRPWQGAYLKTLDEVDIENTWLCTAFVPDENGQKLTVEKILNRLRVRNQRLKTHLWKVRNSNEMEKGIYWTFDTDKESAEEIKKLGLQLHFGIGKLQFRVRTKFSGFRQAGQREAACSKAPSMDPNDRMSYRFSSLLE